MRAALKAEARSGDDGTRNTARSSPRSADRSRPARMRAAVFRGTAGLSDATASMTSASTWLSRRVERRPGSSPAFRFHELERGPGPRGGGRRQLFRAVVLRVVGVAGVSRSPIDRDGPVLRRPRGCGRGHHFAWPGERWRDRRAAAGRPHLRCAHPSLGTDERRYYDAFANCSGPFISRRFAWPAGEFKAPRVFEFARRFRRSADPKAAIAGD